jgi:UDPglucose--hexose-1-phosphate uridylyltransferase
MNTFGVHEIVIETPQHNLDLAATPPAHFEHVLSAYRDRMLEIRKDRRILHMQVVKNYGKDSGSTFTKTHPHSHIIGFPVVPRRVVDKFKGAQKFFSFRERCVWCDMVLQEQKDGSRVILENKHFLSFAPFASRFPFEATIAPRRHMCHFEDLSRDEIVHLADILRNTIARIFKVLQAPAFNYIFFNAPYDPRYQDVFHWHIEIIPRVTGIAGFEWGSGFYINPKAPEEAAETLRATADSDLHTH